MAAIRLPFLFLCVIIEFSLYIRTKEESFISYEIRKLEGYVSIQKIKCDSE